VLGLAWAGRRARARDALVLAAGRDELAVAIHQPQPEALLVSILLQEPFCSNCLD